MLTAGCSVVPDRLLLWFTCYDLGSGIAKLLISEIVRFDTLRP